MSVTMDLRKLNVSKIHVKYGPICVSKYTVNKVLLRHTEMLCLMISTCGVLWDY